MLADQIPAKISTIWAADASATYVRAIPVVAQQPTYPYAASYQTGFPPATALSPTAGGEGPDIRDMNGALQAITSWLQWANAGGPIYYDAAFAATIGGYPIGSYLDALNNACGWVSTVDGNLSNPDTGGAGWIYSSGGEVFAGNPNGLVAGTAAVSGFLSSSIIYDTVHGVLWVCTQTGTASSAVWTPASGMTGAVGPTGPAGPAGPVGPRAGYVELGNFTVTASNTTQMQVLGLPATYSDLNIMVQCKPQANSSSSWGLYIAVSNNNGSSWGAGQVNFNSGAAAVGVIVGQTDNAGTTTYVSTNTLFNYSLVSAETGLHLLMASATSSFSGLSPGAGGGASFGASQAQGIFIPFVNSPINAVNVFLSQAGGAIYFGVGDIVRIWGR